MNDRWTVWSADRNGGAGHLYVEHHVRPRFIARLVRTDPMGAILIDEGPVDLSFFFIVDIETLMAEFDWIDPPRPDLMTPLLERTARMVREKKAAEAPLKVPLRRGAAVRFTRHRPPL